MFSLHKMNLGHVWVSDFLDMLPLFLNVARCNHIFTQYLDKRLVEERERFETLLEELSDADFIKEYEQPVL